MQNQVIVSFGKDKEFTFKFASGELGSSATEEARRWFEKEFVALECDVATPTGKILAVDRILSVAKYAGESRFNEQSSWANQFARYTAVILGRDLIRVDVAHYSIGY
jgi:hypothetical protein